MPAVVHTRKSRHTSPTVSAHFGQMNPEGVGTIEALVTSATAIAIVMVMLSSRLAPVLPDIQISTPVKVSRRNISR